MEEVGSAAEGTQSSHPAIARDIPDLNKLLPVSILSVETTMVLFSKFFDTTDKKQFGCKFESL